MDIVYKTMYVFDLGTEKLYKMKFRTMWRIILPHQQDRKCIKEIVVFYSLIMQVIFTPIQAVLRVFINHFRLSLLPLFKLQMELDYFSLVLDKTDSLCVTVL